MHNTTQQYKNECSIQRQNNVVYVLTGKLRKEQLKSTTLVAFSLKNLSIEGGLFTLLTYY